jgi:hypothetical protein
METNNNHKNIFLTSPYNDQPGNKQYVVFSESDYYSLEGHTHGKLSHAIKHYEEFDKAGMNEILSAALDYLKSNNNIYLKNINGQLIASSHQTLNKITHNTVHKSFVMINDKLMKGIELMHEEEILKNRFFNSSIRKI